MTKRAAERSPLLKKVPYAANGVAIPVCLDIATVRNAAKDEANSQIVSGNVATTGRAQNV
jgi:hypothetical protein